MTAILVTGGAGFIGSHLVRRLLAEGDEVVCLDNFNDYYDPQIKRCNVAPFLGDKNFHLAEGDIRDIGFLDEVFDKFEFSRVVHLAAMAGVRPSIQNPSLYADVNLVGTTNILEKVREKEIPKLIFGSTSSVYGTNSKVPFSEDDRLEKVISPYSATKLACEGMCRVYHHLYGTGICCLRFFTVYGPSGRPDMAIYKFIDRIYNDREIEMYGDGTSKRDYTYIDDIIQGVDAATEKDWHFEIINLGESQTIELRKMIRLIEKALGKKAKIKQMPMQSGDVPITYADISKARRLLDYKPSYPIEKGIEKTVEWYLETIGAKK